jgi:hypothetical protein
LTGKLTTLPREIIRIPFKLRREDTQGKLRGFRRVVRPGHIKTTSVQEAREGGGGDDDDHFNTILALLATLWKILLAPDKQKGFDDRYSVSNKNILVAYAGADYIAKKFKVPNIKALGKISREWCKPQFPEGEGSQEDAKAYSVHQYIGSMWLNFHKSDSSIPPMKYERDLIKFDEEKYVWLPSEETIASEFIVKDRQKSA